MLRPALFRLTLAALLLAPAGCAPRAAQSAAVAPCAAGEAQAQAQSQAPAAQDRVAQIDALAARARELFDVPGLAIAVVHDDAVLLAKGYGERELGTGEAVDARSSFMIASNTKAFAATAVGLLVADGLVGWDDPVIEHIPELELWDAYTTQELRVRDLLSHRVGLATWEGDLMWISSKLSWEDIFARLRHLNPEAGLRERWGYCNLMYALAGELIRVKTGEPWQAFVAERIFAPLGMDAVVASPDALEGRANVAEPHIEVEGEWQTTPRIDVRAVGAAAALDANVEDMAKWLRMQLGEGSFEGTQVVPATIIGETRQPHMWLRTPSEDFHEPARHLRGYGLGWFLEDYRGHLLVHHGGALPGMTSRVFMVPEAELGVVVLTNSESPVASLLALQIADLFLSDEGAPRKDYLGEFIAQREEKQQAQAQETETETETETEPGAPLPAGLEGRYASPLLGAGEIRRDAEGLWFEAPEHGGLRCKFADAAQPAREAEPSDTRHVSCTWNDPNMGVSEFTTQSKGGRKGKRVRELRFKVRPSFYDPLEYTFTR